MLDLIIKTLTSPPECEIPLFISLQPTRCCQSHTADKHILLNLLKMLHKTLQSCRITIHYLQYYHTDEKNSIFSFGK